MKEPENEEEIIEKVMQHVKYIKNAIAEPGSPAEALFGLWDLYNQEKEKNNALMRDESDKWASEEIQEYHNLSSELNQKCIELEYDLQQEKEKNKKLEEVTHNLAQAIRFMSTNENLTVEDIIKEFTENQVTEEFMERWENSQHEESNLKDKVIDMMAEYIDILVNRMIEFEPDSVDADKDFFCNHIEKCVNNCRGCIKEYYFKKVRESDK